MPIFKTHLYQLSAYTPPLEGRDPSTHLLLDFNERTLPVSEPVCRALVEYINGDRIQVYPSYGGIVERIAKYSGVSSEQLMITNGSDQGIELIFRASCTAGDEVIIPSPNFAMYEQCAKIENVKIVAPYYTREKGFPVEEVIDAINKNTRIICIANPNNPSGACIARRDIVRIAEAAPDTSVLVDECYFEYSKLTVCDLIDTYSNIVVTRTFSKTWGIPSLRFGYLVASPENIRALLSVRGPYDINQLAVVAARAALDDPVYTEMYVQEVMEKSKPALESFLVSKAVCFWPSKANYLWVFPHRSTEVEQHLSANGILVRPKADADGNLGLRITIGTLTQTMRLIDVLEEVL